jgi:hypothetical protein
MKKRGRIKGSQRKRQDLIVQIIEEELRSLRDSYLGEYSVVVDIQPRTCEQIRKELEEALINQNLWTVECPFYQCKKWGFQSYPCSTRNYRKCLTYGAAKKDGKIDGGFAKFLSNISRLSIKTRKFNSPELMPRTLGDYWPE